MVKSLGSQSMKSSVQTFALRYVTQLTEVIPVLVQNCTIASQVTIPLRLWGRGIKGEVAVSKSALPSWGWFAFRNFFGCDDAALWVRLLNTGSW